MKHCYTARELGKTFLELLAVVVAFGLLDLGLDLGDTGSDFLLLAGSVDDGGVLLVDGYFLGLSEYFDVGRVEAHAFLLADHDTAGEDGDVFKHLLAAVAEAGSLDGAYLKGAAQAVNHEGGEGFLVDIFGDDQQAATALGCGFEDGEHILEVGNLLVVEEDVG